MARFHKQMVSFGPTSTSPFFDLVVAYFTQKGIALPDNPYRPTSSSSTLPSRSHDLLWFVVAAICGVNAYFAMDRGFRSMIDEMFTNPIGWIGPTSVFAIASVPFAMLSRFTIRQRRLSGSRAALPIFGGLAFGFFALQMDRWSHAVLSSLGQNIDGVGRAMLFAAAVALTGVLAVLAQHLVAILWKSAIRDTKGDETYVAPESPATQSPMDGPQQKRVDH